jgi:hypothetical protein
LMGTRLAAFFRRSSARIEELGAMNHIDLQAL